VDRGDAAVDYQCFDLRLEWFGSRPPRDPIAIVAIDEGSITMLGRRPWMVSRTAALVDLLAANSAAPQMTGDPRSAKD
jgi:CHASE2 domain-containing sensor protein